MELPVGEHDAPSPARDEDDLLLSEIFVENSVCACLDVLPGEETLEDAAFLPRFRSADFSEVQNVESLCEYVPRGCLRYLGSILAKEKSCGYCKNSEVPWLVPRLSPHFRERLLGIRYFRKLNCKPSLGRALSIVRMAAVARVHSWKAKVGPNSSCSGKESGSTSPSSHILPALGFFVEFSQSELSADVGIVCEWPSQGSLRSFLSASAALSVRPGQEDVQRWAVQIAAGLSFVHTMLEQDIFLDRPQSPFSSAGVFLVPAPPAEGQHTANEGIPRLNAAVGYFLLPSTKVENDIVHRNESAALSDSWGLAMCLYEIAIGSPLDSKRHYNLQDLLRHIPLGPHFYFGDALRRVLTMVHSKTWQERPSVHEVYNVVEAQAVRAALRHAADSKRAVQRQSRSENDCQNGKGLHSLASEEEFTSEELQSWKVQRAVLKSQERVKSYHRQLRWENMSSEARQQIIRRKQARAAAIVNQQERRVFLRAASFHHWTPQDVAAFFHEFMSRMEARGQMPLAFAVGGYSAGVGKGGLRVTNHIKLNFDADDISSTQDTKGGGPEGSHWAHSTVNGHECTSAKKELDTAGEAEQMMGGLGAIKMPGCAGAETIDEIPLTPYADALHRALRQQNVSGRTLSDIMAEVTSLAEDAFVRFIQTKQVHPRKRAQLLTKFIAKELLNVTIYSSNAWRAFASTLRSVAISAELPSRLSDAQLAAQLVPLCLGIVSAYGRIKDKVETGQNVAAALIQGGLRGMRTRRIVLKIWDEADHHALRVVRGESRIRKAEAEKARKREIEDQKAAEAQAAEAYRLRAVPKVVKVTCTSMCVGLSGPLRAAVICTIEHLRCLLVLHIIVRVHSESKGASAVCLELRKGEVHEMRKGWLNDGPTRRSVIVKAEDTTDINGFNPGSKCTLQLKVEDVLLKDMIEVAATAHLKDSLHSLEGIHSAAKSEQQLPEVQVVFPPAPPDAPTDIEWQLMTSPSAINPRNPSQTMTLREVQGPYAALRPPSGHETEASLATSRPGRHHPIIVIRWREPTDNGSPLERYLVERKIYGDKAWAPLWRPTTNSHVDCPVHSLRPSDVMRIVGEKLSVLYRISACNALGTSSPSKRIEINFSSMLTWMVVRQPEIYRDPVSMPPLSPISRLFGPYAEEISQFERNTDIGSIFDVGSTQGVRPHSRKEVQDGSSPNDAPRGGAASPSSLSHSNEGGLSTAASEPMILPDISFMTNLTLPPPNRSPAAKQPVTERLGWALCSQQQLAYR